MNIDWGCLRTGCCGEYLDLREMKCQEYRKDHIMKSFVICAQIRLDEMGEACSMCRKGKKYVWILDRRAIGKRPLGRNGRSCDDNIKMYLKVFLRPRSTSTRKHTHRRTSVNTRIHWLYRVHWLTLLYRIQEVPDQIPGLETGGLCMQMLPCHEHFLRLPFQDIIYNHSIIQSHRPEAYTVETASSNRLTTHIL
jgi:hypothetical protein